MNTPKKREVFLLFLIISCLIISVSATSVLFQHGDANGDGAVNLKDVTEIRRFLASTDTEQFDLVGNPDVNGDSLVNMKDVTLLRRYLAGGWGVELPQITDPEQDEPLASDLMDYEVLETSQSARGVTCTAFRYGQSVLARDLVCWSIQQGVFSRTVLLNLAIHGWEDTYAADGQLLVDLGNVLVEHYSQNEDLYDCRLLIIPCANPDGIAEGVTKDGFGRCNADGVDLNRDFDANHVVKPKGRNYTPYPFSAPESRALRDLVWASNPDVVVDFHGWLDYTIGNSDLAEVFSLHTGLYQQKELSTSATGYFAYWAQLQGAEAILVEFTNTESIVTEDVIAAVDRLVSNNYGRNQHDYALDGRYTAFDDIDCFALSSGRVYTHQVIGSPVSDKSYIDGSTDECHIMQIYENGWCKVRYPVRTMTKTAYCQISAFIDPAIQVEPYTGTVPATTYVYTTQSMSTRHGSVWSTDIFTVVAEEGGLAQIIFPLDAGGYKMGWIDASAIQKN